MGRPTPRAVTRDSRTRQWIAYVRLKEPPGLSPITDVGRFSTADDAMVAADEVWAAR
jgi:hypothetical protein